MARVVFNSLGVLCALDAGLVAVMIRADYERGSDDALAACGLSASMLALGGACLMFAEALSP